MCSVISFLGNFALSPLLYLYIYIFFCWFDINKAFCCGVLAKHKTIECGYLSVSSLSHWLHFPPCHRKSFEYEDAAHLTAEQGPRADDALYHAYSDDNIYEDIVCKSHSHCGADFKLMSRAFDLCRY